MLLVSNERRDWLGQLLVSNERRACLGQLLVSNERTAWLGQLLVSNEGRARLGQFASSVEVGEFHDHQTVHHIGAHFCDQFTCCFHRS